MELQGLWDELIAETDKRHARLMDASRAQQFYADAAEAEAWMGEQELHMMSEEKAKVRERNSHSRVVGQGSSTSLNHQQELHQFEQNGILDLARGVVLFLEQACGRLITAPWR